MARSSEDTDAYELYLKGRYYWNRRTEQTLKRAVEYFQQAIDKDPGYALAYAGLADCYAVYNSYQVELPRESGPKAKAAATKALEIDNTLAEAHASLGMTRMSYEWDWAGAEREFQRAIELDPNYATAHHWYGICLGATGRGDEAIASLKRAQQLDPLSLIISADVGLELHFARRYDEAIDQVRRSLGATPSPWGPWGTPKPCRANAKRPASHCPMCLSCQSAATSLRSTSPSSTRAWKTKERALEWPIKAFDDRSLGMIFLNIDPRFDPLGADPRFAVGPAHPRGEC